jgi:hypothetical protein
MVTTRSSQEAAASTSSPTSSQGNKKSSPDIVGSKRKSPASRNEQNDTKKQKTLEESFNGNAPASEKESTDPTDMHKDDKVEATDDMTKDRLTSLKPNTSQTEEKSEDKRESTQSGSAVATAVEEDPKREEATPSNILEKGILYFFFRGRVGIESPTNVNEIARSYIVLRPLPHGAKLSDGPIGDAGNSRLLALPKKVLPSSPKDRFMVFVEKVGTSFKDLRENFIASNDYETKTAGTRHSPAATPAGEGVYAITSTGRESHLAYILTIPSELGKVQKDLGLHERGSFITSVKNPKYESPVGASLPEGANYPQEYVHLIHTHRLVVIWSFSCWLTRHTQPPRQIPFSSLDPS